MIVMHVGSMIFCSHKSRAQLLLLIVKYAAFLVQQGNGLNPQTWTTSMYLVLPNLAISLINY